MRISSSTAILGLAGLVSSTAISAEAKYSQDESKFVKLSFDKLRGDLVENARAGQIPRVKRVKRDDGTAS